MKTARHCFPLLFALTAATPCRAVVLGVETFDTAGPIASQTGGTDWNRNNITGTATAGKSDWDLQFGSSGVVSGGQLVLSDSGALREFNGPGEGGGSIFSDSDSDEEKGAIRATGTVFIAFNMSRSSTAGWSGVSSFDFGAERIFFGVPNGGGATDTIGIEVLSLPNYGTITLTDNVSYTMVAVIDFDNDMLGLYANPDSLDTWTSTGGTADVKLAYTATNWISAIRLGSDNIDPFTTGVATFDNLKVTTTLAELGLPSAVPEPSAFALGSLAIGLLTRRRREGIREC